MRVQKITEWVPNPPVNGVDVGGLVADVKVQLTVTSAEYQIMREELLDVVEDPTKHKLEPYGQNKPHKVHKLLALIVTAFEA